MLLLGWPPGRDAGMLQDIAVPIRGVSLRAWATSMSLTDGLEARR